MAKHAALSPEQIKQIMDYEGVTSYKALAEKIAGKNAPETLRGDEPHIHHLVDALNKGTPSDEIAEFYDEYCAHCNTLVAAAA